MVTQNKRQNILVERYPATSNSSLRAWSAADELMLEWFISKASGGVTLHDKSDFAGTLSVKEKSKICIYGDRFGYLACHLHAHKPDTVISYKSQYRAYQNNHQRNDLILSKLQMILPLEKMVSDEMIEEGESRYYDFSFITVPKSLDLFRLYLAETLKRSNASSTVVCGFMTRHFSKQLLTIAETYFEKVEQSKAHKKARLLILSNPKNILEKTTNYLHKIEYQGDDYQQYDGVFSAQHIDYATQFMIDYLLRNPLDTKAAVNKRVLDLGCGNGVLAHSLLKMAPKLKMHLIDDFSLAIASARLNFESHPQCDSVHFHYDDTLKGFDEGYFDRVVSNPPFHFGHEKNTEIALRLFSEVKRCLKPSGQFYLVANRNLPYKHHLQRLFGRVEIAAENSKFMVYTAIK